MERLELLMETRTIREFLVLADCLNFGEAAEQLSVAQSTLSKHIRALENELGPRSLRGPCAQSG